MKFVGGSGIGPHEAGQDASSTLEAALDEEASRAQWDDDGGYEPDAPDSAEVPGAERERRDDERLRSSEAEAARADRVKAEAERVRFE